MHASQYIGVDVGKKRTGLARASSVARLAEPLTVVDTEDALDTLAELSDESVEAIVVGLPRSLDGNDTEQTRWVRQWVAGAKAHIDKPFYWQDEALTSKLAQSRKVKSLHLDAEAAAIILQDFLEAEQEARVAI